MHRRPQGMKTQPLYNLTVLASDMSNSDWLQPVNPYDATEEAESKGLKVTMHMHNGLKR